MSKKVCVLTSVHHPFDTRIFHKEARTLSYAGYEVVLIAPTSRRRETVDGIHLIGLPRYKKRASRPLNWYRLLTIALEERADIYHFHDFELLPLGTILKHITQRPVIYDVHEHYPDAMLVRDWIPWPTRRVVSKVVDLIELGLSRYMSAVVVADDEVEERFREVAPTVVKLYNFPLKRVFHQCRFSSVLDTHRDPKTAKGPGRVIYVGDIREDRGIWVMLEATSLVVQAYGIDMILTLIGRIPSKGLEKKIREYIHRMGIPCNVEWLGYAPHMELPAHLVGAQVGLIPLQPTQKFLKNVPTKMFEYMACGLPIVASDLPPIRRFMEGADCGFLVDPIDPEGYAEAIAYLLQHPQEAGLIGANGQRTFLEKYNWESEGQKLLDLYAHLN